LTDWNGISKNPRFIGLNNYIALTKDPNFIVAFKNSIIYVLAFTTVSISLGLIFALVFNESLRFATVLKSAVYIPLILPSIVVALQWRWMYEPTVGTVNLILRGVGLGSLARGWLGDPHTALLAIVIPAIWQHVPFVMVIYLAGLTGIPIELLEAATIDGASYFQTLRRIVLPLLNRVTMIIGIMTLIYGLKLFDLVYVLTRGGPGNASEVLANYMYFKSFQEFRPGYGAAIAVVLLLLVSPAIFIYVRAIMKSDERGAE
jgi:ABC-type sugar transport system permease subunit